MSRAPSQLKMSLNDVALSPGRWCSGGGGGAPLLSPGVRGLRCVVARAAAAAASNDDNCCGTATGVMEAVEKGGALEASYSEGPEESVRWRRW